MPFWKGEGPGRPGRARHGDRQAGARSAQAGTRRTRSPRSQRDHGLDALASRNLLKYLDEQHAAAGAVPDDRTILIEQSRDDLGDWRVAVLTPLGSRIHAPWAMAATARIRDEAGIDVEVMWSDDGFVVQVSGWRASAGHVAAAAGSRRDRAARGAAARIDGDVRGAVPRSGRPRAAAAPPPARRARAAVAAAQARLGSARGGGAIRIVPDHSRNLSRVPARHFRSAGADRHPDAASAAASMRVVNVESQKPSPFSASLLFGYVANYIYDGDAPLAERRAQALSVDQSQLRDLIGDTELRDLLDEAVLDTLEQRAAASAAAFPCALDGRGPRSVAAARRPVARGDRGAQRSRRRRSRRSTSWSRRGGR